MGRRAEAGREAERAGCKERGKEGRQGMKRQARRQESKDAKRRGK